MQTPEPLAKLMKHARLFMALARLPVAQLCFERRLNPAAIPDVYANYTRPHPRYKIFGNKALGAALIDLSRFDDPASYLHSVRHHGHAGHQSRKAAARGYSLRRIDRNVHLDDIHAIHTSAPERQGRPMDESYRRRRTSYPHEPHCECRGVFDADGRLAAYCNFAVYGNFAATDQLMGYRGNDGIMYLLLTSIICDLIEARRVNWFMYDTWFGARHGLQQFKRHIGFQPYRARYRLI